MRTYLETSHRHGFTVGPRLAPVVVALASVLSIGCSGAEDAPLPRHVELARGFRPEGTEGRCASRRLRVLLSRPGWRELGGGLWCHPLDTPAVFPPPVEPLPLVACRLLVDHPRGAGDSGQALAAP